MASPDSTAAAAREASNVAGARTWRPSALDGAEELQEEVAVDRRIGLVEGLERGVTLGLGLGRGCGGDRLGGTGAELGQLPGDLVGLVVGQVGRLVPLARSARWGKGVTGARRSSRDVGASSSPKLDGSKRSCSKVEGSNRSAAGAS